MNRGDTGAEGIISRLLSWYGMNKRAFPFRGTRDPYRVWLSEIMLQQTRTETAGPYYERFLARFPDVTALACASEEEVLKAWEGLGYYNRARNLHRAAKMVAGEMGGVFPKCAESLLKLPGVGPYAAAAIASIAFDEPVPAMDGNLNRVISRLFLVEDEISSPQTRNRLLDLGRALMPQEGAGDMNQALMDLGATVCLPGTPDCPRCPLSVDCLAYRDGDPARLPMLKKKRAPLILPVGVVLLQCGDRILLIRRHQALLRGLYVFLLAEGDSGEETALAAARGSAPSAGQADFLGTSRHVFTHRIWEMKLYRVYTDTCSPAEGAVWATAREIRALPLPAAMNAAKKAALDILEGTPAEAVR